MGYMKKLGVFEGLKQALKEGDDMSKQKRGSDKFNVRFPEPLAGRFGEYVKKKRVSMSAVIRDAVMEYLEKREEVVFVSDETKTGG